MSHRKRPSVVLPAYPACWHWPFPARAETVADLFAWHAGRCAVCGRAGVNTTIDHDHKTGLVRGLLCLPCNNREARHGGVFASYRAISPADILDIHIRYHPGNNHRRDNLAPYRQG